MFPGIHSHKPHTQRCGYTKRKKCPKPDQHHQGNQSLLLILVHIFSMCTYFHFFCVWRVCVYGGYRLMDEYEHDNSDMISGLLMERSHHSTIVYLSICVPSHCPQQTLINICVLDERANLPPCQPLNSLHPQLCIVLQQFHTHVAVPRHTIYIGTHTLGLIFLDFQDRSEVGSEI